MTNDVADFIANMNRKAREGAYDVPEEELAKRKSRLDKINEQRAKKEKTPLVDHNLESALRMREEIDRKLIK